MTSYPTCCTSLAASGGAEAHRHEGGSRTDHSHMERLC